MRNVLPYVFRMITKILYSEKSKETLPGFAKAISTQPEFSFLAWVICSFAPDAFPSSAISLRFNAVKSSALTVKSLPAFTMSLMSKNDIIFNAF